jgi:2-dehydropantoate 2-reductase
MRIAIIGSGGIGGIFGAALAKAGNDVTFVARGAHLDAIRRNGMRVEGDRGTTHIHPAQATDEPAGIGPVDLVLFCVKLWDVETGAERIQPIVGPDTAVIPLQNGIDAPERLIAILGPNSVMGGTAMATGAIIAPGVIRQTGTFQRLTFGELDGRSSARAEQVRASCEAAGFEGVLRQDIELAMWEKFTLLAAHSGMTALTRLPIGKMRDDPDLFGLYEALLREVAAVGRARGVPLKADIVETLLALLRSLPPQHMASMATDLLRGNRLELPWMSGKVVALGREHSISTPANAFVYTALKPYANGAPV